MKSYTDINQSKKLAEILPLESADRAWYSSYAKDGYSIRMLTDDYPLDIIGEEHDDIPAWSLAALFDVLPTYLFEFDRGIDLNVYPNLNGKGWHCSYIPNNIEDMKTDKFKLITSEDTLVDACVELIIKLHEQKL